MEQHVRNVCERQTEVEPLRPHRPGGRHRRAGRLCGRNCRQEAAALYWPGGGGLLPPASTNPLRCQQGRGWLGGATP